MELKLLKQLDDQLIRVEVSGKISRDGWTIRQDPLAELYGKGIYGQMVLLNLSQSMHIDSTGVEWLLACHKQFDENGGKLIIHSANRMTSQMLQMMRMDLVLNIAPTEASARVKARETNHEQAEGTPVSGQEGGHE